MSMFPTTPPRPGAVKALSIAGSDPSGGAGVQADLKSFSALGAYGMCVLTALTAQSTTGVRGVHAVPAEFVHDQLVTLVEDITPDAVKIGMLGEAPVAAVVESFLQQHTPTHVVLDPVMVSTSGDRLLADDAVDALRRLLPLASIVTPNLAEASVLLDRPTASDPEGMRAQASALLGLGCPRVYLKGGHLPGATNAGTLDVYADADGVVDVPGEFVPTTSTHGTGCSLSSAMAALRPQRSDWVSACRDAKSWLTGALQHADELVIGRGYGPVHHFWALWPHLGDIRPEQSR